MKNVNANNKRIIELLKDYFDEREDIVFAFLFGSAARGKVRREGDIDIAIYFQPEKDVEWENFSKKYKGENRIALDLERLLKKEIDLVVLNRTKSVLADEIIRRGKPIIIKDRGIFMDFLCIVSDEAEYVRDWLTGSYKEKRVASGR
jgi:predicted nucleotidyltransferase